MKIALFATEKVGLQIARFMSAQEDPPACLVLDGAGKASINTCIRSVSHVEQQHTIVTSRETRDRLADQLCEFEPDLCILAWWPYILKLDVLSVPRIGTLNFHPSLLPHGRGKAPNFWSLVEGTPFGVTIHWVDEEIDSGDIAFQREIPITWEDTGKTLYQKSLDTIVELFQDNWPAIRAGRIPRMTQPEKTPCHFQRELDAASQIELGRNYTGRELLSLIRARTFESHPAAWFEEDGRRYEVRISISQVEERQNDTRAIRRA